LFATLNLDIGSRTTEREDVPRGIEDDSGTFCLRPQAKSRLAGTEATNRIWGRLFTALPTLGNVMKAVKDIHYIWRLVKLGWQTCRVSLNQRYCSRSAADEGESG
jgi:hypothetical protein